MNLCLSLAFPCRGSSSFWSGIVFYLPLSPSASPSLSPSPPISVHLPLPLPPIFRIFSAFSPLPFPLPFSFSFPNFCLLFTRSSPAPSLIYSILQYRQLDCLYPISIDFRLSLISHHIFQNQTRVLSFHSCISIIQLRIVHSGFIDELQKQASVICRFSCEDCWNSEANRQGLRLTQSSNQL